MAKEKAEAPAPAAAPADAAAAPKKKGKLFPMLIIAALMGVEGVGVFFATKMFSGGEPASAEGAEHGEEADAHAAPDSHEAPAPDKHAAADSHGGGGGHGEKGGKGSAPTPTGPTEIDITEVRPNNRTSGKLISLKMRVSALVEGGNVEKAKTLVESNKSRINDRVNVVVRSATAQELNEPGLETIKRRFKQELSRVLGDEKLIIEVLIPEMMQSGSGL